jgi:hypothetical protein
MRNIKYHNVRTVLKVNTMRNIKYHNVRTVLKVNRKILTYIIFDCSLSWLGTDTSVQALQFDCSLSWLGTDTSVKALQFDCSLSWLGTDTSVKALQALNCCINVRENRSENNERAIQRH